jgi:BirA family biotin operon repressor/biotin-[acetyl-CoA-carboxylase] ligase
VNSFNLSHLRSALKPFRLYWYPRLRSTNDHAAALRRRGDLFAPAVVLTGHQTAGRGRGNNAWWSAAGCLTVTFVLATDEQVEPHQVPLLAGLAVRNAAAELTGDNGINLKWPNDLLYNGRKLGGLLCERVMKADLIGLGLNVNVDPKSAPRALRDRVTSLRAITGEAFDMTHSLAAIARHLYQAVSRGGERPFAEVLREYDAHHSLLGQKISIVTGDGVPPITGRCEGLDDMGRLLLRSRAKLNHIISGQVHVIG